tara:strand:+ start:541 stop:717 length:177 start_codon:yes stop_codon:yes gene_type:complete
MILRILLSFYISFFLSIVVVALAGEFIIENKNMFEEYLIVALLFLILVYINKGVKRDK